MATSSTPIPKLSVNPVSTQIGSKDLRDILTTLGSSVLNDLLLLAGIIAVLYLIYAGYRYISAGGDPAKAKAARAGIFSAVIGVIIVSSAFVLVNLAISVGSCVSTLSTTCKSTNTGSTSQTDTEEDDPANTPGQTTTKTATTDPSGATNGVDQNPDGKADSTSFKKELTRCAGLATATQKTNTTCRDYFLAQSSDHDAAAHAFNTACLYAPAYFYCDYTYDEAIAKALAVDAHS